jgi:hypothetical protein
MTPESRKSGARAEVHFWAKAWLALSHGKEETRINTRYYEDSFLQANSVQGTFPWEQAGNRHFPWFPRDGIMSSADSFTRKLSVQLRSANQWTTEAEEVIDVSHAEEKTLVVQ